MLDVCKRLFKSWNDSDVRYCHWKSNEHLEPGLDGLTDLDIYLHNEDRSLGTELLKNNGFVLCNSQFGFRYPGVCDWVGFDDTTGCLVHVHLHYRLITGHKGLKEYCLPWDELCLQSRVLDKTTGVFIMEPNLELMTLFTRISLKINRKQLIAAQNGRYKLSKNDQREITYLKERIDWKKVKDLLEQFYPYSVCELLNIFQAEVIDSKSILLLRKIVKSRFDNFGLVRKIRYKVANTFYKYSYFIRLFFDKYSSKLFIFKKTPLITIPLSMAFVGQDGSGKSTVSNDIKKWLTWKLDARRVYLGSGEHYHSWEKKVLKYLSPKKSSIWLPVKFVISVSNFLKISRKTKTSVCAAMKYAEKGGIPIFDRFPQVQFEGINDGPKISSSFANKVSNAVFRKLIFKVGKIENNNLKQAANHAPALVFKLMLPPEESLRRKPEERYEVVSRKHQIIKNWNFDNSEVHIIDATLPYEEELLLIKRIIWQKILQS